MEILAAIIALFITLLIMCALGWVAFAGGAWIGDNLPGFFLFIWVIFWLSVAFAPMFVILAKGADYLKALGA